jgi:hypothetical protein
MTDLYTSPGYATLRRAEIAALKGSLHESALNVRHLECQNSAQATSRDCRCRSGLSVPAGG